MKECKTCKINLDESRFSKSRIDHKTGKIYYKNDCKECSNKRDREKRKTIKPIMDKKESLKPKDTITNHNIITRLTLVEKEIESLKVAIKGNTITDNKSIANYKFDKATRIKTTYNIEMLVKSALDKYCKSELKNNSDIVNIALMQYLKL
jgi:hypothetical protein